MALVKFGAGVSEMRGKEGGVIYSRNAFGSYIKTKVSPVNPQTSKQQVERGLMGNLASTWSTLSGAGKGAWDNLGAQVTRVNRFGDSTIYTGFALFMRLNRNLSTLGISAITTAPTPPTLTPVQITSLAASVGGGTINLGISPTSPGAAIYLVVYCTNNIVTGRRFVKNFYRLIHTAANPAASPVNLNTSFAAYFPAGMQLGASLFVKAKYVDSATGFDTTPDVASCVIAA